MADEKQESVDNQEVPLGQKLLDRPFLLLIAGILVMAVFYTLWGIFEVVTLPEGKLP